MNRPTAVYAKHPALKKFSSYGRIDRRINGGTGILQPWCKPGSIRESEVLVQIQVGGKKQSISALLFCMDPEGENDPVRYTSR